MSRLSSASRAGQVDREIDDALGKVRAFFDVDRCVLLKVIQETKEVQTTHVKKGDGTPPIPTKINYVDLYPWSTDRTIRRGEVLRQRTRDFPPEAAVDRASAESMGVKSFLTIPFLSEGAVRYLIHISILREGRVWPEEYTPRLRLGGEILMNALERKRADEKLRQHIEFEVLISDLQVPSLCIIDCCSSCRTHKAPEDAAHTNVKGSGAEDS